MQPAFDFTLPYGGSSPTPKQCSYDGAVAARERMGRQCVQVLEAYAQHGPLTDLEVEALTKIRLTSVIPRRRFLMTLPAPLVAVKGWTRSKTGGKFNTLFGLQGSGGALSGRDVAGTLARAI